MIPPRRLSHEHRQSCPQNKGAKGRSKMEIEGPRGSSFEGGEGIPEDKVKGRLLLDVVIREGTTYRSQQRGLGSRRIWAIFTILKLLSGKDETLLIGGDSFFVLNFGFDIVDGVRRLHLKGNRLTRQGLDKDLH